MPTYDYKREDGTTFEIEQRITAPSLTVCPTTGQKVKRIISSGAGLVFKGSGFYQTDYVRKSNGDAPGGKEGSGKGGKSAKDTASATSDSKGSSATDSSSSSESSASKKDSSNSKSD